MGWRETLGGVAVAMHEYSSTLRWKTCLVIDVDVRSHRTSCGRAVCGSPATAGASQPRRRQSLVTGGCRLLRMAELGRSNSSGSCANTKSKRSRSTGCADRPADRFACIRALKVFPVAPSPVTKRQVSFTLTGCKLGADFGEWDGFDRPRLEDPAASSSPVGHDAEAAGPRWPLGVVLMGPDKAGASALDRPSRPVSPAPGHRARCHGSGTPR